jgi:hypothetical protein
MAPASVLNTIEDPAVSGGLSPDVVAALEEVQYNRGFEDGAESMRNELEGHARNIERQAFEDMKGAAETFFQRLIKIVPESGVVEYRLGWDSTTGVPATLAIISRKHEAKLRDIQDVESACELDMIRDFDYDCFFWVITDEKLDKGLIHHDFPFLRMKTDNVHV